MNFVLVLVLMFSLVGCAKNKSAATTTDKKEKKAAKSGTAKEAPAAVAEKPPEKRPEDRKPVITPATESSGRVSMVNQNARFVVLTYAEGNLPAIDRKLSLYRNGLKVAEVKVTGPQRDNNTIADIVAGDAALNDEVRE